MLRALSKASRSCVLTRPRFSRACLLEPAAVWAPTIFARRPEKLFFWDVKALSGNSALVIVLSSTAMVLSTSCFVRAKASVSAAISEVIVSSAGDRSLKDRYDFLSFE